MRHKFEDSSNITARDAIFNTCLDENPMHKDIYNLFIDLFWLYHVTETETKILS